MKNAVITATGSYIPPRVVPNEHFLSNEFFGSDGERPEKSNTEIINKLYEITGIKERRYAADDLCTSDIAALAAEKALEGRDREQLDYIIVAQNLGDMKAGNIRTDILPPLASRVKHLLGIRNPYTVAFDLPFGCPGWIQGMITADYFIKSGDARQILVIGAEILSRVVDPHDVDCMIFADGAGAALVEATDRKVGILSHLTRSDAVNHVHLLNMGASYNPERNGNDLFVKMLGHDIYKYAVRTVPKVVKKNLDDTGLHLRDVSKVMIHQANEKMDEAILKRLFQLYKEEDIPQHIMPMTISWAGNSSVATLPTMFDLICREEIANQRLSSDDIVLFASVGAGMNINSMIYRMP